MAKTKEEKTELTIVQQPKYKELIEKSGIELTKAEAHVQAFGEKFTELSELSRHLAGLKKVGPTPETAKQAREHRLKLVKVRTGAESIKDERKKILLVEGSLIQSVFNVIKDSCIVTESEYEEIEKHQERLEAKKREELKEFRLKELEPYEVDTTYLPLDVMDEERYSELLSNSKLVFEAKKEAARKAEEERIENERLAAERAEQERIEREAEEKRIREENERLKKEAEEKAQLHKKRTSEMMLYTVMIRDFNGMLNMEEESYQKELSEIKIGYQQHLEYQEKERKKKEAEAEKLILEQADRLARQKVEAEKSRKAEEEKQLAAAALKAPDVEKLRAFYVSVQSLVIPEMKSKEGKAAAQEIKVGVDALLKMIEIAGKSLK